VQAGADLVCFSGDKVFGGPQAGIIVGKADLIAVLAKHPLMRIIRPGKSIFALLQEYLVARLNKTAAGFTSSVLSLTEEDLAARGEQVLDGLDSALFSLVPSSVLAGGGSSPEKELPSLSVRINISESPDRVLARLRSFSPPVIGIIKEDSVLLNLATLLPEDVPQVRNALENL
jgi:L-seryl-tRNA(Ser) seleniumtransferase